MDEQQGGIKKAIVAFIVVLVAITAFQFAVSTPYGSTLDTNTTENPGTKSTGLVLNHTKGKITTLRINATQPNLDWKGYVGNVSGTLVLDDASNNTLFEWNLSVMAGEVYATRDSGSITWASVGCANAGNASTENTALGLGTEDDNITNTFDHGDHDEFYVGTTQITANSCDYSDYMYINNEGQTTSFPEVLMSDGTNILYTAIMENATAGFDGDRYDFQMIVGENGDQSANIGYYFYVELG